MEKQLDTWDWDDLPRYVQEALDNTPPGEWCEFTLVEEDGCHRQYRLRLTRDFVIDEGGKK